MDDPQDPQATPEDLVTGRVAPRWTQVIEDMHATAEEYADADWGTVQLHPGDVTVLAGDTADGRAGLAGDEHVESGTAVRRLARENHHVARV